MFFKLLKGYKTKQKQKQRTSRRGRPIRHEIFITGPLKKKSTDPDIKY